MRGVLRERARRHARFSTRWQKRVLQILQQWFADYDNLQADDIPDLQQTLFLSSLDQRVDQKEMSWEKRINKARSVMKTVSRNRKLAH